MFTVFSTIKRKKYYARIKFLQIVCVHNKFFISLNFETKTFS